MSWRLRIGILALTASTALHGQPAPRSSDARVARSRDSLPTVSTAVSVNSAQVASGTRLELILTATNHGTNRVIIGVECGPSLDALAQFPDGTGRSALWDSVAPNADFTCPGGPSHYADPGQTKTERIVWSVPAVPGTYQLRAALRRGDGLGNFSPSITIVVP